MKYLSVTETSQKWGIDRRWIQRLCKNGRIDGVIRLGNAWGIPDDAEKPKDERIKSGKYVKHTEE